jgi:hypothetical protein
VIVGVGQSRDVEFIANNPGDWMLHCHILHHMMNHMVSMVGPMAGMGGGDAGEHGGHAMPEISADEAAPGDLGAGLVPSLGPSIGRDRAVMTGMRPSDMKSQSKIPGYPQDMMGMHGMLTSDQMRKVSVPLTRGMRRNWPIGVMAMMTVVRVLPDELYDKVVSGKGNIEPGASVPGGGPGEETGPGGHHMHGSAESGAHKAAGHSGHEMQHDSSGKDSEGAHHH